VDLEEYSFEKGSTPLIRPTEKTIPERLPPRIAIRKDAAIELPHVILLVDDPKMDVIEPLFTNPAFSTPSYSVELMEGAGTVRGFSVTKEGEAHVAEGLRNLMPAEGSGGVLLMVGDGNHSLATAKACWESVKDTALTDDPRRYALAEVQNLHDPSCTFEPIHRVLFNVDAADFTAALQKACPAGETAKDREFRVVSALGETVLTTPGAEMSVVTISEVVDAYLADHSDASIDFVHGEQPVLDVVARETNSVGLILPPIAKDQFVSTLKKCGVMPRKSFSMGEAEEKRFYIEARGIRA
jgi:hypothetical protein